MVQRFRNRTGGVYSNPLLNLKVSNSSGLINWLKQVGSTLSVKLRAAGGDVTKVTSPFTVGSRPIFNGLYNKFHGLQILINDTEYGEVVFDNFVIGSLGDWTSDVTVTIRDHFGLDKHDAITYQGWHEGFPSWWALQHMRNYVPFETGITLRKNMSGHL